MFTTKEILKATKGRLIQGDINKRTEGISIDSRTIKKGEAFIALKGPNFEGHNFIIEAVTKGALCVVASYKELLDKIILELKDKNLDPSIIYVEDTQKALVDLALFNRKRFFIPLIAITGTNGKTTTKDMTADILSLRYKVLKNPGTQNNIIGLSLSLLRLNREHKIAVLELGTNHPGEIETLSKIALPNIGVITNIGPGHLEFFNNVKNVFREKYSLLKNLIAPEIAVLNRDDFYIRNLKEEKSFGFGLKNNCDFRAEDVIRQDKRLSFSLNKKHKFLLETIAKHNVYNALVAITSGVIFGIDIKKIKERLLGFQFPSSRLNVLNINDAIILDDTYNSNPLSLRSAIDTLSRYPNNSRKILVMADMLELGKNSIALHQQIGRLVARSNIDYFITLGEFSKYAAWQAHKRCDKSKKIFSFNSHQRVSSILLDTMKKGDVILVKGSRAMQMEKIIEELKKT